MDYDEIVNNILKEVRSQHLKLLGVGNIDRTFYKLDKDFFDVSLKTESFTGISEINSEKISGHESLGNSILHNIDVILVFPSFRIGGKMEWSREGRHEKFKDIAVDCTTDFTVEFQLTFNIATKRVSVRTFRIPEFPLPKFEVSFHCYEEDKRFCNALTTYLTSDSYVGLVTERIGFHIRDSIHGLRL